MEARNGLKCGSCWDIPLNIDDLEVDTDLGEGWEDGGELEEGEGGVWVDWRSLGTNVVAGVGAV